MKNYSLPIILFLIAGLSYSQDSSGTSKPELKHGIQFQILSLLEFTNFDGYTLSYRYCLSNNSGLRLGIYTNISETDNDINRQLDSIISIIPGHSDNYSFKLSAQYIQRIINHNRFYLILGGGPFVSYNKRDSYVESLLSTYTRKTQNKEKSFAYGVDLILGIEYEITENVVFSGEYGLSVYKERMDIDEYDTLIYNDGSPSRISKEYGEAQFFTVRGTGVNLGLTVFF